MEIFPIFGAIFDVELSCSTKLLPLSGLLKEVVYPPALRASPLKGGIEALPSQLLTTNY